jgi:hypothetical protein
MGIYAANGESGFVCGPNKCFAEQADSLATHTD